MDVVVFLQLLRSRLRWVVAVQGLAILVIAVMAVVAGSVLIDWLWRPPGIIRLCLLSGVAFLSVTVIARRLWRPLATRLADKDLALVVERRMPELDGMLITQVEGIVSPAADLAPFLDRKALKHLVPARHLPRYLMLSGAILAAFIALACIVPHYLRDGLMRLFLPLGDHDWTRTSALEVQVERAVVAADEPVVLDLRRRYGPDAAVRLTWFSAPHAVSTSSVSIGPALTNSERTNSERTSSESRTLSGMSGPWHQPLSLGLGSWIIQADSGDAASARAQVTVLPRPRLDRIEATLTPPAYTRQEVAHLTTLDCTALPGSTLTFIAWCATAPGQELARVLVKQDDSELLTTRDRNIVSGSIPIRNGGSISFSCADTYGIELLPTPRFTLTLAEDRKPVVSVSGPRPKELVTLRAQVQITVEGSDDIGLAELALTGSVQSATPASGTASGGDGSAQRHDLVKFPEVSGLTATTRRCTIVISDLATQGGRLILVGRAADANDVTGPGIGESAPLELSIVDEDALRSDLDRFIAEARDRTTQARTEIIGGLSTTDASSLSAAARGAALATARASDTLDQVMRRWRENRLPEEQAQISNEAAILLHDAKPQLELSQNGAPAPARMAEVALGKAERLLSSLLSDSDLTRQLAAIIDRQRALNNDSRIFIVNFLTKAMDPAGRALQSGLVARQQEIATQVKDIERKILAGSSPLADAQELVRRAAPAENLNTAAQNLGSERERSATINRQTSALDTLITLLDLLRGSEATADLAQRAGELAKRQEALAKRLEMGAPPGMLADDQKQLQEDTQHLAEQLAKQAQAQKAARAAGDAQKNAQSAMRSGDKTTAQREADAAGDLLRDVQRQLSQKDEEPDPKEKKKDDAQKLIDVLKRLHRDQTQLVADAAEISRRLGDKALDFPGQRSVLELGKRENSLRKTLATDVIAQLTGHPIAILAVTRVDAALERSEKWMNKPALGDRGMRMAKVALAELARLVAIAEQQPPSDPSAQKNGDGKEGGGAGGGNQAPFPPQAELSLLAAMQEEIARVTVTGAPRDVAAGQKEVAELIAGLNVKTRPGSRPQVLLHRALQAAQDAGVQIQRDDRGLSTRHQQEAAATTLRQLIAESAAQNNSGGGGSKQQQRRDGDSPPSSSSGQAQNSQGNPGSPGDGKTQSGDKNGKPGTAQRGVLIQPEKGDLLQLPPELRERLRQAREQPMPPGSLPVYERYLELLEGAK